MNTIPFISGPRERGVTLIEVLVAVLLFSLGLIGIAGLLVVSSKANHAAYLRTQATFLAESLVDRMRANPVGVWNDEYDDSYPVTGSDPGCVTAACTPTDISSHDKAVWSTLLDSSLPNASASVECTKDGSYTPSAAQIAKRPPFGGSCTILITWNERGLGADDGTASPTTFSWVVQP